MKMMMIIIAHLVPQKRGDPGIKDILLSPECKIMYFWLLLLSTKKITFQEKRIAAYRNTSALASYAGFSLTLK